MGGVLTVNFRGSVTGRGLLTTCCFLTHRGTFLLRILEVQFKCLAEVFGPMSGHGGAINFNTTVFSVVLGVLTLLAGCTPSTTSSLVIDNGCLALPRSPDYRLEHNSEARYLRMRPGGLTAFNVSLVRTNQDPTFALSEPTDFELESTGSGFDVEVKLLPQRIEVNGEPTRVQLYASNSARPGEHQIFFRALSEGEVVASSCVVATVERAQKGGR